MARTPSGRDTTGGPSFSARRGRLATATSEAAAAGVRRRSTSTPGAASGRRRAAPAYRVPRARSLMPSYSIASKIRSSRRSRSSSLTVSDREPSAATGIGRVGVADDQARRAHLRCRPTRAASSGDPVGELVADQPCGACRRSAGLPAVSGCRLSVRGDRQQRRRPRRSGSTCRAAIRSPARSIAGACAARRDRAARPSYSYGSCPTSVRASPRRRTRCRAATASRRFGEARRAGRCFTGAGYRSSDPSRAQHHVVVEPAHRAASRI